MEDFQSGKTLLFDKPLGWSSFDLVKKVRNTIRIKKVGHAGTLDPLATGLLIICTGKHTKTIPSIQEMPKEYEVRFKLGATTASYDAEQPEENHRSVLHITEFQIKEAIDHFIGEIEQTPPMYSAVKVDGKRAYELARKGQHLQLKKRKVNIYEFSLLESADLSFVKALIKCSKGTYIRSLIHDLGQQLGVGAYIKALKRTRIGIYALEDAWDIHEFVKITKESK